MSIESRRHQYGTVFLHWQIQELLGNGSGGKTAVFRLKRIDSSRGQSALKVINLIEERGNFDSRPEFLKEEYEAVRKECMDKALEEVWMMDDFQGNTNIVDYLDHQFVDWTDESGFGCDMLIRMELLKDLRSELQSGKVYTQAEIVRIGCDICKALVLCHRKGILHRDIKPENIFINRNGDYKLGDFGISRIIGSTPMSMASTGIGTPEYAAPEQISGKYDKRVDIYSLGLVLYELSNRSRLPFAKSSYIRPDDVNRRMAGAPLPPPCGVNQELADIILRACAYKCEQRYQTAEEFLAALSTLSSSATPEGLGKTNYDTANVVSYATVPALNDNRPSNISFTTQPAVESATPARGTYETVPAEGSAALASARMKDVSASPSPHTKSQVSEPMPKKQAAISEDTTQKTVPIALSELKKAAAQGDAAAQYQLGHAYAWGEGAERNNEEAVKWYRLSADQGYPNAQDALGYCYEVGKGVAKDTKEALKWYNLAAAQNYAPAQKALGSYYYNDFHNRDYSQAAKWFTLAAEQGNRYAIFCLAECYFYGRGVEKNNITALQLAHQAKADGHAKADNLIYTISRDDPSAAHQFKKWLQAQEKLVSQVDGTCIPLLRTPNTPDEQFELGNRYFMGDGVEQNYGQAVQLFELAARADHAWAQYSLGFCYSYGLGVSQDHKQAVSLFQKASAKNIPWAQNELGKCYYNGWGVEQDRSEAVKLYRRAAEQGDVSAQYNLGCCFYLGEGILQNDDYAAIWFKKAAEQGLSEAQYLLGNIHCSKAGPSFSKYPKETIEAMKWYQLAKNQGHEQATARYAEILNRAPSSTLELLAKAGFAKE